MNTTILRKCVAELQKESPRIDYVLGQLEAIIEMNSTPKNENTYYPSAPVVAIPRTEMVADEARTTEGDTIPDFLRPGPLATQTN